MLLTEKNVVNVTQMKTLNKHKRLIQHDGEIYSVLGEHNERVVDKSRLGLLVKWYGGDKVLAHRGKYLICETIQEAITE